MDVYIWHKAKPLYEPRMRAITAYTLCAQDLGTDLALVPKDVTKGQNKAPTVTENVPFRCFPA